jgi:hypothetical protein
MKLYAKAIQLALKVALLPILVWEICIIYFEWGNGAGALYSAFLNTVFILMALLLLMRSLKNGPLKKVEMKFKDIYPSVVVAVFSIAVVYCAVSILLYHYLFPDFYKLVIAEKEQLLIADDAEIEMLNAVDEVVTRKYSIVGLFFANFLGTFAQGLFGGAVLAGVFTMKSPEELKD